MSRPKHLWRRIVRRQRVEADLDAEVRAYFDILIERGMAQGLTREEAQRAARLRFGGVAQVKERVWEARAGSAIETTFQDVRYGWGMLAKSPGFTCFAVLTIALGLGANAAIFSFVDGMLFKPSGYPEADRIVQLWETRPRGGRNAIAPANYVDWTKHSRSFTAMAARAIGTMSYMGDGEAEPVRVGFVSARCFDVFGVTAVLGRTFAEDEDRPGHEKVVVISHRSWRNLLGAERGVIGRNILLNGRAVYRRWRAARGEPLRSTLGRSLGSTAMQTVRGDAAEAIKEGRTISIGRRAVRARQIFIAAQVAVVFILLVGGGLLIRSLQRPMTVDVGFVPEGVMSASLPLPVERDPNPSDLTQYINRLLDEVRAAPGSAGGCGDHSAPVERLGKRRAVSPAR